MIYVIIVIGSMMFSGSGAMNHDELPNHVPIIKIK